MGKNVYDGGLGHWGIELSSLVDELLSAFYSYSQKGALCLVSPSKFVTKVEIRGCVQGFEKPHGQYETVLVALHETWDEVTQELWSRSQQNKNDEWGKGPAMSRREYPSEYQR